MNRVIYGRFADKEEIVLIIIISCIPWKRETIWETSERRNVWVQYAKTNIT